MKRQGFALIELLIVIVVIIILGAASYFIFYKDEPPVPVASTPTPTRTPTPTLSPTPSPTLTPTLTPTPTVTPIPRPASFDPDHAPRIIYMDANDGNVYRSKIDGSDRKLVYSSGGRNNFNLQWSNGGSQLMTSGYLYFGQSDNETLNYLINLETNQTQSSVMNGECFQWSPDNTKLIYRKRNTSEIYLLDLQSGLDASSHILNGYFLDNLTCRGEQIWFPDNRRLVFANSAQLSIFDIQTKDLRLVYEIPYTDKLPSYAQRPVGAVTVNKLGTRIAFVGNTGNITDTNKNIINDIHIINTDGTGLKQLTFFNREAYEKYGTSNPLGSIVFSRDSKKIFFVQTGKILSSLDVTSGQQTNLLEVGSSVTGIFSLTVSSDDQYLAYAAREVSGGRSSIYVMNIGSRETFKISSGEIITFAP